MGNGESEDSVDSGNSTSHSPAEDSKNSLMLTTSYFTNTTEGTYFMLAWITMDLHSPLTQAEPNVLIQHNFPIDIRHGALVNFQALKAPLGGLHMTLGTLRGPLGGPVKEDL